MDGLRPQIQNSILLILMISLFSPQLASAQFQFFAAASFTIGDPTNRIGISGGMHYQMNNLAINTSISGWYYADGIGAANQNFEGRGAIGVSYLWGELNTGELFFQYLSPIRENAVGYQYIYYLDKNTTQTAGSIHLRIKGFEMITENDALGWQGKDRYRTGTLNLAWYQEAHRIGLNMQLWTGSPHDPLATTHEASERSNSRWGYRDLSKTKYGKISHGILAVDYARDLGFNQIFNVRIGMDDERIRHAFQNKLFHDWLLFLSKVKNRHVPMLDINGNPFIDKSVQQLRPAKAFLELGLNAPYFY